MSELPKWKRDRVEAQRQELVRRAGQERRIAADKAVERLLQRGKAA